MFMRLYAKSVASVHFNIVRQSLCVCFFKHPYHRGLNFELPPPPTKDFVPPFNILDVIVNCGSFCCTSYGHNYPCVCMFVCMPIF